MSAPAARASTPGPFTANVELAPTMVKAHAYALGFDLAGIASLGAVESAPLFEQWLDRGFAGEMAYLARGAEKRRDSRLPVPGTISAVVVALNYGGREPAGPVARYARGDDYHDVMLERLARLHSRVEETLGRSVRGKAYVDTGPLLERDLARRAGLGWFGKNTNLLNPKLGSFFFIGALLLDLALEADAPFESDHCGSCTRCIDACPTGAIVEPRVLDATRCLSYTTIELRGEIPEPLREAQGDLLYGCDICQDVCPWNERFAQELGERAFAAREALAGNDARTLAREILSMDEQRYREAFKGSPMKRAKLRGLKRNAAVVLGNIGAAEDIPALTAALADPDPLVSRHAEWALGTRKHLAHVTDADRARSPVGQATEVVAFDALSIDPRQVEAPQEHAKIASASSGSGTAVLSL